MLKEEPELFSSGDLGCLLFAQRTSAHSLCPCLLWTWGRFGIANDCKDVACLAQAWPNSARMGSYRRRSSESSHDCVRMTMSMLMKQSLTISWTGEGVFRDSDWSVLQEMCVVRDHSACTSPDELKSASRQSALL